MARRKLTLREFTRQFPAPEDQERFRNAMNDPSDIVTAIVQAIEVEYTLEQLIIERLERQDDYTIDLLSKENGALATFFSKIGLAYAMGLIDADEMECVNTVRRIRNAFAHARKTVTFATPLVRREMASAKLPKDQQSRLYKNVHLVRRLCAMEIPPGPEDALGLTGRAAYVILSMTIVELMLRRQAGASRKQLANFLDAVRPGEPPADVADETE